MSFIYSLKFLLRFIINFYRILSKLPGDFFHFNKPINKIPEVMQYLHTKVEEHERTLDPNNPRDYIDVFLIEKSRMNKLHPDEDEKAHYFTGNKSISLQATFTENVLNLLLCLII
jgi:hypothetical protein